MGAASQRLPDRVLVRQGTVARVEHCSSPRGALHLAPSARHRLACLTHGPIDGPDSSSPLIPTSTWTSSIKSRTGSQLGPDAAKLGLTAAQHRYRRCGVASAPGRHGHRRGDPRDAQPGQSAAQQCFHKHSRHMWSYVGGADAEACCRRHAAAPPSTLPLPLPWVGDLVFHRDLQQHDPATQSIHIRDSGRGSPSRPDVMLCPRVLGVRRPLGAAGV
ncbi:uncharacterized protein PSFLO_01163 [Pseudozyma flocculosa]|uniref:Uncharacterized protein n=1 Tax=Pseudozyma flocculosa TaxID=84751 RepID=A0A5C3EUH4_9BASI|nr:uncharacterized protein PSFLO_01163 [Pseudozyma flocculosa]